MGRYTLILIAFSLLNLAAFAQSSTTEERANQRIAAEQAERQRKEAAREAQERVARNEDFHIKQGMLYKNLAVKAYADRFYRDPTTKELEAVAVMPQDLDRYKKLNLGADSGIFRLLPSVGCGEPGQPVTGAWCLKYSMPGNGSRYSFRERKYRFERLSDVAYEGGFLKSGSVRTLSFMVNLGRKDISAVANHTEGMRQIFGYRAPSAESDIEKEWSVFQAGQKIDGFSYATRLPIEIGSVYAIRSIAYRGFSGMESQGYFFNELSHDKRRDCIVVFELLNKLDDGSITVVWRLLRDQESPKPKLK